VANNAAVMSLDSGTYNTLRCFSLLVDLLMFMQTGVQMEWLTRGENGGVAENWIQLPGLHARHLQGISLIRLSRTGFSEGCRLRNHLVSLLTVYSLLV
jgi:hypothetical protein